MIRILASILVAAATISFYNAQAQGDQVQKAEIRVNNLHCNGDMPTIKKQLLNEDGIDNVTFTERKGNSSTFSVTYHSAVINTAAIEQVIESTPGCDDKSETPYRVQRGDKKKKP